MNCKYTIQTKKLIPANLQPDQKEALTLLYRYDYDINDIATFLNAKSQDILRVYTKLKSQGVYKDLKHSIVDALKSKNLIPQDEPLDPYTFKYSIQENIYHLTFEQQLAVRELFSLGFRAPDVASFFNLSVASMITRFRSFEADELPRVEIPSIPEVLKKYDVILEKLPTPLNSQNTAHVETTVELLTANAM